jgi:ribulose-5-phosphate 4-epimerase/fuculose-1-phosphate aldolase
MRIEGEDAIAVTPTRLPYGAMIPDDICIVDLDLKRIEGERKPSIEAPMHVAAYRTREDVSSVIHTHQSGASVCSVITASIPAMFDEVTLAIGSQVDLIPYAMSGSRELHDNVTRALANRCHCYIMQNHGALCVGADLEKTFTFVELLEKTAAIYVQALATGQPVTTLPEEIVAQLHTATLERQNREIARRRALAAPRS